MCTLWIAQPLYDLLGGMPNYFLVRGLATSGWSSDIVIFALAAFLVPPLVFVVVAELLGLIGLRRAAYTGFMGLLAGLAALLVGRLVDHSLDAVRLPGWLLVALTLATGAAAVWLLRSERAAFATRYVLKLLALLAPLAPALFLLRPEIRGELAAGFRLPDPLPPLEGPSHEAVRTRAADAHIVVLVLDELPTYTLVDAKGRIEPELFPHLAEFAATSTWFHGATTPAFFTQHAVPALVAGRLADIRDLATVRTYPDNLLTLLRGSRRVVSDEPMTAFDPLRPLAPRGERLAALASDAALLLAQAASTETAPLPWPAVRAAVGAPRDPTERFEAFLDRVAAEADRAARADERLLVFSHLLLPHHPWVRDERGVRYDGGDEILIAGIESPQIGSIHARWRDDWETVLDSYERHVLQTRHADRLVGRLLGLLREKNVFDRSLIVIAADHGIRFAPGAHLRQPAEGLDSLEQVPLLLKLPGQSRSFQDGAPRSTLDVLPTILAELGLDASSLDLPGTSLLGPAIDAPSEPEKPDEPEVPDSRELRVRWLERRALAGPDGFGPWHEQLAGRPLRIGGVPTRDWVADLDRAARLEDVAPDLPPPRRLSGRLLPRRPEALAELIEAEGSLPLGVGVDGVMVATTLSSQAHAGDEHLDFSVLLPPEAVAPGPHQIVIYQLAFQDDLVLQPQPIPQRMRSGAWPELSSVRRTHGAPGEARAVRLAAAGAPVEIFGWVPADPAVRSVLVYHRGRMLTEARWIGPEDGLDNRYRFGDLPDGARAFRAVVPTGDALRVVALLGDGEDIEEAVELPLAIDDESVWRVTGPFFLHPDPRKPPAAYQNY